MKTQFYILLSLRTPKGFVDYGQFNLGDELAAAYSLFETLKGTGEFSAPLHIDLMETVDELPVKIKTICCSLEQLSTNCRLIAKEMFRLKNLEELV